MNLTLPGYHLIETLHEGSNTVIHRASRQSDGTLVIVKAIKAEHPTLEELTRLRHEYKILQQLVNIEKIVKPIGIENYHHGLVLILLDFGAESLRKYLSDSLKKRKHSIELIEFLNIAIQLAATLGHLHEQQIIHKDIKPQNIVIN